MSMLLVAVLSSAACHSMRPVAMEELAAVRPGQVWVTRADQSVVLVAGPQIVNNRLVGFVDGVYRVIPAADVQRVVMRRPATGRTAALVSVGAVGAASVIYLLSGTGGSGDPCMLASSECGDQP
jgi:hypothetical protein